MADELHSDFIVFVDESGDHSLTSIDKGYPVFVLCFCILSKNEYSHKIAPAIRDLKYRFFGHDQVILHERDIRKRTGDFKYLHEDQRRVFLGHLSQIIDDSGLTVIAVVIDKPRHLERYHSPEHPYHLALMYGLERVYGLLQLNGQQDRLTHVICESRGKREDRELELEFRRVCAGQNWGKALMPFEIVVADKRSNSEGLQLADLTARPIGLSVIKPDQPNQSYSVIAKKFFKGQFGAVAGNGLKVFP